MTSKKNVFVITNSKIKNVHISFLFKSILWGILLSSFVISAQRTPPQNYNVLLSDDFDGTTLNTSYWTKGLYGSNGAKLFPNPNTGGRNKLNDNYAGYILDSNTVLNNGILELHNKKEVVVGNDPEGIYNFSNAWINGLGKIKFNGSNKSIIIKIRMKLPTPEKDDVWPAVWLVEQNDWPAEIDVWEYFGSPFNANPTWDADDRMVLRYIYGSNFQQRGTVKKAERFFDRDYDVTEFRTYEFEWTNDVMISRIENIEIGRIVKGVDVPENEWPSIDEEWSLIINNGRMNRTVEGYGLDYSTSNVFEVDWIDVYEKEQCDEATEISIVNCPDNSLIEGGAIFDLDINRQPVTVCESSVSWNSSNPLVATVDENGIVTPLTVGNTIISVTSLEGLTDSCQINVKPSIISDCNSIPARILNEIVSKNCKGAILSWYSPEAPKCAESYILNYNDGSGWQEIIIDDDTNEYELDILQPSTSFSLRVRAVNSVGNGPWYNFPNQYTTLPNTEVNSIVINNCPSTFINLDENNLDFDVSVLPEIACDKSVLWSSSDTSVATVDSETGKISLLSSGFTTIRATSNDNGLFDECTITIIDNNSQNCTLKPKRPLNLNLTPTCTGASINWDLPEDFSCIDSYILSYRINNAAWEDIIITENTISQYDLNVVQDSSNIVIRLRAQNSFGLSPWSTNETINSLLCSTSAKTLSNKFENKTIESFSIYPNPVSDGTLTIRFGSVVSKATISISNTLGQEVKRFQLNNVEKKEISTRELNKGTYFFKVYYNGIFETHSIVIN